MRKPDCVGPGRKPPKTDFGVSDQVRYKKGCTVTENDKRLEISDLDERGLSQIVVDFLYNRTTTRSIAIKIFS